MTSNPTLDGVLIQWGERLFYPGNRIVKSQTPRLHTSRQRADAIRRRIAGTVRRAPQVMVKVTGGGRGMAAIAAHFRYISKNGRLPIEDDRGVTEHGKDALQAIERQWRVGGAMIENHSPRREAFNIMLSMPRGTDPLIVQRAAREFAKIELADHRYVMVLHDHQANPHVHISVRAESKHGKRLNPRKADLQLWREIFAAALRDRGVEAEATPRRARGVVRKAERTPVRKLRERFERGDGPLPKTLAGALESAARPPSSEPVWEARLRQRQSAIRRRLVVEALRLQASKADGDRRLGQDLERFIRTLPPILTQREILARALAGDRGGADRRRDQIRER